MQSVSTCFAYLIRYRNFEYLTFAKVIAGEQDSKLAIILPTFPSLIKSEDEKRLHRYERVDISEILSRRL